MISKIIKNICIMMLIILIVFTYAYLFIGAWHAHPNAEDFSLTAKPLHFGIIHSIKHTLLTYDGRYFTNILHAFNPLALGWVHAYKWQTIFTILLLPLSLSYFLKNLLVSIKYHKILLFSFMFSLINYALSPSLPHQVYWMVSSFVYTYCWILWFLWLGAYLNYIHTKKYTLFILALILLVFSNGINEMFLIINGVSVLMFFLNHLYSKQFLHQSIALMLSYMFSMLFFISNPGIIIRFNSFSEDKILAGSTNFMFKSLKDFLTETGTWFSKDLIFISFIVFVTLFFKEEIKKWSERFTLNQVLILSALILISIYFSSYAFYIPMGHENEIPYRIYTSINLGVQLLFSFLIPIVLLKFFCNTIFKHSYHTQSLISIIIIISAFIFGNNNISVLKNEFKNNVLSDFDSTMNSRYLTITEQNKNNNNCWKVAELKEIVNPPKSIYSPPDILSNKETYYWNNAYEKYFLIDEVRLIGDSIFDIDLIMEYGE